MSASQFKQVRTRFAPSPTGHLHIGGARTALFCWLYAHHHQGQFILRIEDTDRERSTDASIQAILDSMAWLSLDYDEGPYYQTQHMARYQTVIDQLLAEGQAYRCYCSKQRLEDLRNSQLAAKQKPRYDGHCRDLTSSPNTSSQPVIRFKNPHTGTVTFNDLVRGPITINNNELDDLIIARSDGTPTYNLTVVVDDWDMKISHVIRGDDHINNTPRQINILQALNAPIPHYGHVPMILGPDGKRLSKRQGAESVMYYHEQGILPTALLNYLLRLGWSHGDQEIFSREEMIKLFDTDGISHSPAAINQDKLLWLNQHYLKTQAPQTLTEAFSQQLSKLGIQSISTTTLTSVITAQAERSKTLVEMAERSLYFFQDITQYDEKAAKKHLTPKTLAFLQAFASACQNMNTWDQAALHQTIVTTAEQLAIKLGKLAQPIRVAVTGNTVSPPIDVTLALIGQERVLTRIHAAINYIEQNQELNH